MALRAPRLVVLSEPICAALRPLTCVVASLPRLVVESAANCVVGEFADLG